MKGIHRMKKEDLWHLMGVLHFIRITGLPQKKGTKTKSYPRRRAHRGCWSFEENLVIAIDVFGDTWILPSAQLDEEHRTALEVACPSGYTDSLPPVKVRSITPIYLTFRRKNPEYTPEPGDLERLFRNRRKK